MSIPYQKAKGLALRNAAAASTEPAAQTALQAAYAQHCRGRAHRIKGADPRLVRLSLQLAAAEASLP